MLVASPNSAITERIERFVGHYGAETAASEFETRRAYARFPMNEPVDVMIDSSETPAEIVLATGRDISNSGIGVYSHQLIAQGTEMLISIDNGQGKLLAKAVAVHSTLSVGMYKVGMRFIV